MKATKKIMLLVVAVLLTVAGAVAFFVSQGRAPAAQYAGIGSFLVGLIGLGMSSVLFVVSLRNTRSAQERQTFPSTDQVAAYGPTNIAVGNETVHQGIGDIHITKNVPEPKPGHRST